MILPTLERETSECEIGLRLNWAFMLRSLNIFEFETCRVGCPSLRWQEQIRRKWKEGGEEGWRASEALLVFVRAITIRRHAVNTQATSQEQELGKEITEFRSLPSDLIVKGLSPGRSVFHNAEFLPFCAIWVLCLLAPGLAQITQTAVTLWQFGRPRLLPGQVTAPLQPLGTASDGGATTYLYQALNPGGDIVTTDEGGFLTTKKIAFATPRTIVASASGWVEIFETGAISCGFVDSTFGQCLDSNEVTTSLVNSGLSTPVVIPISEAVPQVLGSQISTSLGTAASTSTFSSISPTSTDTDNRDPPAKKAPVGAIIGGVIGVLLLGIGALAALWWCRRRRLRHIADVSPRPYNDEEHHAYNVAPSEMGAVSSFLIPAGPVFLGSRSRYSKHKENRQQFSGAPALDSTSGVSGASSAPSNMPIPASKSARALHHRTNNQDFDGSPPPPRYS
ncbi:hypothetical protein B0H14DRAFT_3125418 [Mycena olivaceomarginata]|nr:hypothetical protein B0H14DRAFT_3125418 [Mycena olivaceomarginata]